MVLFLGILIGCFTIGTGYLLIRGLLILLSGLLEWDTEDIKQGFVILSISLVFCFILEFLYTWKIAKYVMNICQ